MLYRYKILYDIHFNLVSRFPVSYIYKCKFFYSYKFKIFFPILIPRFETEGIVDFFISIYSVSFINCVLEIGFGSGIISASLARVCSGKIFIAVDSNFFCLKVAKFNLKFIFSYNVIFFSCNFFDFFLNVKLFDCIISNPPYLSFKDIKFINTFECKFALLSKSFGYYDLYSIIKLAYDSLCLNGSVLLEHGYNQSKMIRKAMFCVGFVNIYTYNDCNGLDRFTYAEK